MNGVFGRRELKECLSRLESTGFAIWTSQTKTSADVLLTVVVSKACSAANLLLSGRSILTTVDVQDVAGNRSDSLTAFLVLSRLARKDVTKKQKGLFSVSGYFDAVERGHEGLVLTSLTGILRLLCGGLRQLDAPQKPDFIGLDLL